MATWSVHTVRSSTHSVRRVPLKHIINVAIGFGVVGTLALSRVPRREIGPDHRYLFGCIGMIHPARLPRPRGQSCPRASRRHSSPSSCPVQHRHDALPKRRRAAVRQGGLHAARVHFGGVDWARVAPRAAWFGSTASRRRPRETVTATVAPVLPRRRRPSRRLARDGAKIPRVMSAADSRAARPRRPSPARCDARGEVAAGGERRRPRHQRATPPASAATSRPCRLRPAGLRCAGTPVPPAAIEAPHVAHDELRLVVDGLQIRPSARCAGGRKTSARSVPA